MSAMLESNEGDLPLVNRGKVRDVYRLASGDLLIVATDRISAFDYVLPTPIPGKGEVLTQLSNFWFDKTAGIIANHLVDRDPFADDAAKAHLRGRSVVVQERPLAAGRGHRARLSRRLGLEGVPRAGHGVRHPAARGLIESSKLPEPIFTPSTKAEQGARREHRVRGDGRIVGEELAAEVRDASAGALHVRRRVRAPARHHHRRHEVRVRAARRRADPDRRGADARLLALLAGRQLRAGQAAAELRQAVRARLPGEHRLEQAAAGAGAAARSSPKTARSTGRRCAG